MPGLSCLATPEHLVAQNQTKLASSYGSTLLDLKPEKVTSNLSLRNASKDVEIEASLEGEVDTMENNKALELIGLSEYR